MRRLLFLTILPLLSSSCNMTQTATVRGMTVPTPDSANNEAIICVYRPSTMTGMFESTDILLNNKRVGSIRNNSWMYHYVKPGSHFINNGGNGREYVYSWRVPFVIEPGEVKFFQRRAHNRLLEVPASTGRRAIQSMRFNTITR